MSWFAVIILALVEGITEFLPISSTGHMILAGSLWQMPQTEFAKSFEIIVQLGAILAVLATYWKLLWTRKDYWLKIVAALVPTLMIAYFLYPLEKQYLLGNVMYTLVGLLVGAVGIVFVERWYAKHPGNTPIENMTWLNAAIIGVMQCVAIFPGISRSAVTVLTAMMLGLGRSEGLTFSFLLALPVMAAATGLDVLENGFSFSALEWTQLGVGFVIAFMVAFLSVKWLISFVQKRTFIPFAWYRVILVALFTIGWVLGR